MKRDKCAVLISCAAALLLSGCGSTKIVIPSYAPPQEYKKIEGIQSGGDMREGSYLAMAINPDVSGENITDKGQLEKNLISAVKQSLTETNFITIYPVFDLADVALNMEVISYSYAPQDGLADIQVSFSITKGVTEYLHKTYSSEVRRSSFPSKNKILYELSKSVVEDFISDISPLKTYQLREFKPLKSDLEYVLTYAKRRNYESAIEDMESYDGERDLNYFYNLAVLYEALASKHEKLTLLAKADKNYKEAMKTGGFDDELVVNAKSRFDNFYRLIKMADEQERKNKVLKNELDDMFGKTE